MYLKHTNLEGMNMSNYRTLTAYIAAPILAVTGFRFSKDYRWGASKFHRAVYAVVSTVQANILADRLAGKGAV